MKEAKVIDYDAFRDQIGTVDEEGKRRWVFPKKPKGQHHRLRVIVTVILLSIFFAGPFIKIGGYPLLLLNILERKFIILGVPFWPQDFHLLALGLITLFLFIILFTVIFGRIWCGWACPQTLFMEMVFRKIEYAIEGDAPAQRKLARAPWNGEKIFKKGLKWTIFFLISFLIAHTVMSYLISWEELIKIVQEGPDKHWGKFTFVIVFSGLFFFVFTYLREQACIVICPYGRLQGALLDKNSIVVHYDHVRGEPRGPLKKGQDRTSGDCIACKLCVQVCPTGIDIKDGTQMECVNCTACMDVCDSVMEKVGFEKGLIRYASYNQVESGQKFSFTPRIIAYIGVLFALVLVMGFSLSNRNPVEGTILRTKGTLYQIKDEHTITNLFNIQIINKTHNSYDLELRLLEPEGGSIEMVGQGLHLNDQDMATGSFFIQMPRQELTKMKQKVQIGIYAEDVMLEKVKSTFVGPPVVGK
ncbi:MAG: cytochrome c oxidase accessory protein CcoG [Bacteroidota bacterium]